MTNFDYFNVIFTVWSGHTLFEEFCDKAIFDYIMSELESGKSTEEVSKDYCR